MELPSRQECKGKGRAQGARGGVLTKVEEGQGLLALHFKPEVLALAPRRQQPPAGKHSLDLSRICALHHLPTHSPHHAPEHKTGPIRTPYLGPFV